MTKSERTALAAAGVLVLLTLLVSRWEPGRTTVTTEVLPLPSPFVEQSLRLNINQATAEQLEELPGIGPVLAQRILAQRPFAGREDLLAVSGIGESVLAGLEPYITY